MNQEDRFPNLPLPSWPKLEWPNGARVALWVMPNVNSYGFLRAVRPRRDPWLRTLHPDILGCCNAGLRQPARRRLHRQCAHRWHRGGWDRGSSHRAKVYASAGADMIFHDTMRSEDDIKRLVDGVPVAISISVGFGIRSRPKTPLIPTRRPPRSRR